MYKPLFGWVAQVLSSGDLEMMWSTRAANARKHDGARSTQELFPGVGQKITRTLKLCWQVQERKKLTYSVTIFPKQMTKQSKHQVSTGDADPKGKQNLSFKRPITCGAKCLNDLAELRRCFHATAALHNEQT